MSVGNTRQFSPTYEVEAPPGSLGGGSKLKLWNT